jgi:multiple antibiotic resistance protein
MSLSLDWFTWENFVNDFIILWAVVDPIGTVPVFIAATKGHSISERISIAKVSSVVAVAILMFFLLVGEFLLKRIGVPLTAFQVSGGVILFLFALDMIFGNSKPEEEIAMVKSSNETAIFPLAIPSIAGPGSILAVILLTDSSRKSLASMLMVIIVLIVVLAINYLFMRFSGPIFKIIGNSGAIVTSKIMGLILASMAATNILVGIRTFFEF